jgi:2-oxoglutarate dehydrogenase complex dehydrogenase (E1) component-like enzyme
MVSWLQANSERRHNLIVVAPSTPAQYFHCLRRQIHRSVPLLSLLS